MEYMRSREVQIPANANNLKNDELWTILLTNPSCAMKRLSVRMAVKSKI